MKRNKNTTATQIEHTFHLRPVMVKLYYTENRWIDTRGLFHQWVADEYPGLLDGTLGQTRKNYALIEFEDGTVKRIKVRDFRFLDTRDLFENISWEDIQQREDERNGEERTDRTDRP